MHNYDIYDVIYSLIISFPDFNGHIKSPVNQLKLA
jgi:hypothetical protein